MKTFAWRISGRLVIVVSGRYSPSDEEWVTYTAALAKFEKPWMLRGVVYTEGGGPSMKQRVRFGAALGGAKVRLALMTPSLVARLMRIISNTVMREMRLFGKEDYPKVCAFLELRPRERAWVAAMIVEMTNELGLKAPQNIVTEANTEHSSPGLPVDPRPIDPRQR